MVSASNLIKYLFISTRETLLRKLKIFSAFSFVKLVLLCCLIQLSASLSLNNDLNDFDLGDDLYETLPIQHHRLHHQEFRRASLRYHPHVLYKKASLRPIIGQNGKIAFTKRDQV